MPAYFDWVVSLIKNHRANHPLRDRVIARLKWILFRLSATPRFPIVTGFVIEALVESWSRVAGAVQEVSLVMAAYADQWPSCLHIFDRGYAAQLVWSAAHLRSRICGVARFVTRTSSIEDMRLSLICHPHIFDRGCAAQLDLSPAHLRSRICGLA
jgi:hypothetical protein